MGTPVGEEHDPQLPPGSLGRCVRLPVLQAVLQQAPQIHFVQEAVKLGVHQTGVRMRGPWRRERERFLHYLCHYN